MSGHNSRERAVRALLLLAGVLQSAACATASSRPPTPDLQTRVSAVVEEAPLDQVHWGILAVEAGTDRAVYQRNAHRKFVPASNMKLLSTSAALTLLGPDFRYETALWGAGSLDRESGTLDGDLVLVGRGDPTLSSRFHDSGSAALEALADSLRNAGVRSVRGRLVVDASRWDSTAVPDSWMVGNLPWRWGASGGPFAVDEGELRLEVIGGRGPEDPAEVTWEPRGDDDYVVSNLSTVHPDSGLDVRPRFLPESRRLVLEGTVPAKTVDTLRIAARAPVHLAGHVLHRILEERGVRIAGDVEVVWSPEFALAGGCFTAWVAECRGSWVLATLRSPPLSEIIRGILEPSQNWMTEQLVRTLGDRFGPRGGWPEGLGVVRDVLTRVMGVDSLDLSLRDGSGLSAYNLVTPRAVVRILDFMHRSDHGEAYRSALAAPGEEESTLERRLKGLDERVQAKTGSITHVNALSGYLTRSDGTLLSFSVLTNGAGLPSETIRDAIDEVVRELAR